MAINLNDHVITLPKNKQIAVFQFLSPQEEEDLIEIGPELLALDKMKDGTVLNGINQIICTGKNDGKNQPKRPPPEYDKIWFPTPETCQNPENLPPVQRKIYDQLTEFQKSDTLDPVKSTADREKFLKQFNWSKSALTSEQITEIQELLVEYYDIFAKHRFDVGYNTELKVKLTPAHDLPVYVQSPPTPIHLREEILVELALMQYYGIVTLLPNSKYSSPIFAQRKPSGKLRILIDLRRVNHLLRKDYSDNNFPISNMTDAVHHFAGKTLFTKLDCSQAYHCVQMADPLSVQLLSFNFASRTYAYTRLAQGLNKSVTGFSSFVRNYLDSCLAANLCTQFMDDIGCGVETFEEMIPTLKQIFDCLRKSGLRLTPHKCEFGMTSITFLGNTITPKGLKPETEKIEKFLKTIKVPATVKQVKRLVGFALFFRNFMPNLAKNLMPWYKLLRKDVEFTIEDEHLRSFDEIRKNLLQATKTTLRLAKPGQQYVILCDASYYSSGFVLMIEDYLEQKDGTKKQAYAPVSFGSQLFNTSQLKMSTYCKEFLALHFALEYFSHFIWGAEKPVIILTDNKSLTSFFQSKSLHPALWNFMDRVIAYNIVLAHIPSRANAAADFLSRMQTDPSQSLELQLLDSVPMKQIEIDMKAKTPDASMLMIEASEHTPHDDTTNKLLSPELLQTLQSNAQLQQLIPNLKDLLESASQDSISEICVIRRAPEFNSIQQVDPLNYFEVNSTNTKRLDIQAEQRKDPVIQKVIDWIEKGCTDDLTYASFELKKYYKHLDRLQIRKGILFRKFFDDVGKVSNLQVCIPKHLRKEVVYRIHNSPTGGHIGIVRTAKEFRKRFYFPGFSEFLIDYVKNCLSCLTQKRVNKKYLNPPLQPLSSEQLFPGDMLQIDLVGPFQSPIYKYVLSGIDVFSKYLFAIPLTSAHAANVAKALMSIFFQHSYVPTRILSDLGTSFVANLIHELANLLEIKIDHASLKHPQTIGVVERSHAALKRILKLNTDENWTTWYKYVDLATFIHNTSYHSSIGCTPSSLFHGREPIKPIDLRFRSHALAQKELTSDYLVDLQDSLLENFSHTKSRLLDAYHKYRTYYDKKAAAKPLAQHDYCLLLNPSLTTQSDFAAKSTTIWLSLYRVEKVLTKSNYLIRKVGTPYTQCVHRIRLRPIKPNYEVEDIQLTLDDFKPDPSLGKYRSEHEMFDEALDQVLQEGQLYDPKVDTEKSSAQPEVEYLISGAAVPAATPHAAPTAPFVPPPPAPESAPLTGGADQLFPEPTQPAAPTQVHTDKPRLGVPLTITTTDNLLHNDANFARNTMINEPQCSSTGGLSETSGKTHTAKIRFDEYDYARSIPNRHELTTKGYYSYLDKQANSSASPDSKRELIRKIASNTRDKISKSKIPVPELQKSPDKPILKNRYPVRPNRGQPASSSDIYSPQFQLNYLQETSESITLPDNIEMSRSNLFDDEFSNFAFCINSDLKFDSNIQRQFVTHFPDMQLIQTYSQRLKAGSVIAHFSADRMNWIYALVLHNCHTNDSNTDYLHKCLCRLKSHMITNGIKTLKVPQLGLEHNLEWRRALLNINRVFADSDIYVQIIIPSCRNYQAKANYIVPDNRPTTDELKRRQFHMCTARKLAFQGMMQTSRMEEANKSTQLNDNPSRDLSQEIDEAH